MCRSVDVSVRSVMVVLHVQPDDCRSAVVFSGHLQRSRGIRQLTTGVSEGWEGGKNLRSDSERARHLLEQHITSMIWVLTCRRRLRRDKDEGGE